MQSSSAIIAYLTFNKSQNNSIAFVLMVMAITTVATAMAFFLIIIDNCDSMYNKSVFKQKNSITTTTRKRRIKLLPKYFRESHYKSHLNTKIELKIKQKM